MTHFLSVALFVSIVTVSPSHATEAISWDQLIDHDAQVFEDPYQGLSYDQLDDVRTVAMETKRLEEGGLSSQERVDLTAKRDDARSRLDEAGIDAELLIDQRWVVAERREKAATAVNSELDEQTVVLSGFAIPAPPDVDGSPIVYLVPERGMCSHMPPPNPNQMIRARLSSDWAPSMIHEPIRLTGRLTAQETQHVFRIVDGNVPMRASFIMNVQKVDTMNDLRAHMRASNPFAAHQSQRLGETKPRLTPTK